PATTTASPPWPPTRSGAGCLPSIRPRLPTSTLPPYTTLFRSHADLPQHVDPPDQLSRPTCRPARVGRSSEIEHLLRLDDPGRKKDRKSTRLNSSHVKISYAVFCFKKKGTRE